jgi:hypothetical protein
MEHNIFQKIQILFVKLVAKVKWDTDDFLTDDEKDIIRQKLIKDYYVIMTRRENFLSTFFINLGHFLLTGKWGYYSHTLVNLEDEVNSDDDFRLIEATGVGVHFSKFNEVFDPVQSVALLAPKNISIEEWTAALDNTKKYLGVPYDNLFDLKNDMEINCVELIYLAVKTIPGYKEKFSDFERIALRKKKLTPQMLLECKDFHLVYEIRK